MVTVLAQLATHASRAIARAARMRTLGNLRGVLATPCRLLSLRLFYEAKMVTVLTQLNAHASHAIARDCACCVYQNSETYMESQQTSYLSLMPIFIQIRHL